MPKFSVYFVVKDWIEVSVKAVDEATAKIEAKKIVEGSGYISKKINVVDGNTEYAGITLLDVVETIDVN